MAMHEDILKKLERRLDRRGVSSRLRARRGRIPRRRRRVAADRLRREPGQAATDAKKDPSADKGQDGQPEGDNGGTDKAPAGKAGGDQDDDNPLTRTRIDADGNEYRECPQCGHNMYRQGRTWTCENCGYSYIE